MTRPVLVLLLLASTLPRLARGQTMVSRRAELDPNRLETGAVPIMMGDSDLGFGTGGALSLARFRPGYEPFRWQLMAVLFLTMKNTAANGFETVFHNHIIRLDLPGLAGGRLRLQSELAFGRHSNLGYYGLGNQAAAQPSDDRRRYQYDRIYPEASVKARVKLAGPLALLLGGTLSYNWVRPYPGSKLAEDLASDDPYLKEHLKGTTDHLIGLIDVGILWDTRDHDMVPTRGVFHELSGRFTPNLASDVAYGGGTIALRFFRSLYRDRLVFASRVMGDFLVGNPPIYELARNGGLGSMPSPGGGSGIRGVPQGRFHGRVKLVSNVELRGKLLPFTIKEQRFNLGATVFADVGRVWSDFQAPERFDGSATAAKVGLGGGARLQWGEAFLMRMDLAWSPDAEPVGFYFNVNHVF